MRYGLTDFEWAAIRSFPPNKQRGPRVDERRVLNGIFFIRMIVFDKARDLRGRDRGRKQDRRQAGMDRAKAFAWSSKALLISRILTTPIRV
jgi:hypothetical protein